MKLKEKLIELDACKEAIKWASDMTINQAWEKCRRGDWMMWYYARVYPKNIRELTLAKGHCANTIRHLMRDQRSIDAVDAAISFGEGKISENELMEKYKPAYAAYFDSTAAYTAYATAADAADAAAYGTAVYAADAAAYGTSFDHFPAKRKNQQQTADICRKYLRLD